MTSRGMRAALRLIREGRVRWLPAAVFEVDHRDGDAVGFEMLDLWELYVSGHLRVRPGDPDQVANPRPVELTRTGEALLAGEVAAVGGRSPRRGRCGAGRSVSEVVKASGQSGPAVVLTDMRRMC